MKKRLSIILTAAALLCAMLLTSCGASSFDYRSEDLSAYVTVGNYSGVAVEVKKPEAVTDDAVEEAVKADFSENLTTVKSEDADYAAKLGDTVNIDYVGTLDGVAFDNGSATGDELELGSNSFIEGFEDGLVGKKAGEKVELNLTFPDPYEKNADLSGKAVVFTVTVNSISTPAYSYSADLAAGDVVANGDIVTVKYAGLVDGVIFDGASADSKTLTLGSNAASLPEGFEAALAGAKVGEETEISVTLPADFADADVAGKTAVYKVTVTGAKRAATTPEISDAMIAALSDDFDTLEAYRADKKTTLTETYDVNLRKAELSALWKVILDASEIKSYPSAEVKRVTEKNYEFYDGYAGYYYGLSLKQYARNYYQYSKAQFKTEVCEKEAKEVIAEKLVFYSIMKKEGWELTDEEKEAGLKFYYEKNYTESYETYDEFVAAIDVDAVCDSLLWDKGVAILFDAAQVTYN